MKTLSRIVSVALVLATAVPMLTALEGCSSTAATAKKKQKAAGSKGPAASKTAGQKAGATASAKKDTGTKKGAELDGVACDASLDGTSWCSSETEITFCSGGEWYALNCGAIDGGFCGEDVDTLMIDCYVPAEF
jgi:uncharacterized protein YceK